MFLSHHNSIINRNNKFVSNGLILHLDAANRSSYPTSGTLWTDLSSTNNNATLVNGPSYSGIYNGGIFFDGINDHATFSSNPVVTNQITVEVWSQTSDTSSQEALIIGRESSYRIMYGKYGGITWVCATSNNGWYTAGTFISACCNQWSSSKVIHTVGTYNGSNNRLYVDGVLQTTSTAISGNVLTNGTLYISRTIVPQPGEPAWGKGTIHLVRIYNRALTDSEILLNYNGFRQRYLL